jgi:hypothetical protein
MTNLFAAVVVAVATNAFRLGGVPTDRVESDIEYAGRLNRLGLLAGALNVTLEAIEGLRVRNLGLAAAVSNLTARVEALERKPVVPAESWYQPHVTNVVPRIFEGVPGWSYPVWTNAPLFQFPTNWNPWGTGVSVWITNTPCGVAP